MILSFILMDLNLYVIHLNPLRRVESSVLQFHCTLSNNLTVYTCLLPSLLGDFCNLQFSLLIVYLCVSHLQASKDKQRIKSHQQQQVSIHRVQQRFHWIA